MGGKLRCVEQCWEGEGSKPLKIRRKNLVAVRESSGDGAVGTKRWERKRGGS